MLLDSEPAPRQLPRSGSALDSQSEKNASIGHSEEETIGCAFEFVAGKSIPAFFGALSRVAEGFEYVQSMWPFISLEYHKGSSYHLNLCESNPNAEALE